MYNTIILAIKAYIKQHPHVPDNYFHTPHRRNTGWFGNKIYLVRENNSWLLRELNFFQLALRKALLIVTFGFYDYYGDISMRRFKSLMQSENQGNCTTQVQKLYTGLMKSAARFGTPWKDKTPKLKENTVWIHTNSLKEQHTLIMEMINSEPHTHHAAMYAEMQKKMVAIGHAHYKTLFHSIDRMSPQQRASLVRLLNNDVKLSLGIWTGIMHHAKTFQQSTRENVRGWIEDFIHALSIDQWRAACQDAKFWEVVGLFPSEVSAALSVQQWQCMIEQQTDSELVLKIMLKLPVDDALYDKLLLAANRLTFEFREELGMRMLINQLRDHLKSTHSNRSIDALENAFKVATKNAAPATMRFK